MLFMVIQFPADHYIRFCEKIAKTDISSIKSLSEISKNRRPLIPYGAVVMAETLQATGAEEVSMSAFGLREGLLFSLLNDEQKQIDPLLAATRELCLRRSRSPQYSQELCEWTQAAFEVFGLDETEDEKRYRNASCYLSDIAWRSHADHKAEQTLGIVSNAGLSGISHEGRAYLAITGFHRYRGFGSKQVPPVVASLASPRLGERARILAGLFRLLYLFTTSISGVLPHLKIVRDEDDDIFLDVPKKISNLVGERPQTRLEQLARELKTIINIRVV